MRRLIRIIGSIVVAILILLTGGWIGVKLFGGSSIASNATVSNTQQILSIEKEEQIVLLALGIQGVERRDSDGEIWGMPIPGSNRTKFLQYEFRAKIGIDGRDVKITEVGVNRFKVSIPKFLFIGHDDVVFQDAVESGGALSWTSREHKTEEMVNHVLGEESQAAYLAANEGLLRDQAQAFYSEIIRAIEPSVELEFVFE